MPCFNNAATVECALASLRCQTFPIDEFFVLDDCSTDGGADLLDAAGFRCLRQQSNKGRGATRNRAMVEANAELVVSCDATNRLPHDFIENLLPWFDDPRVAAVYGWIQDPHPKGASGRWRARHLFKAGHPMGIRHNSPLITYGTIIRRSAALEVGNFNTALRHTEDAELGERLLAAGFDIIFDPRVPVFCNVHNTMEEALNRYWRWYAGVGEPTSWYGYMKDIVYSAKGMAVYDISQKDLPAALISLLCAHYKFWKSTFNR
ncbi:MAG: glycosyltransferase [Balneolales bacterium]